jgi:eukaryotic-like serine/threonine-protein kinase
LSPTESPGPSASPTTSATTGGGPIQISGSAVRIVDPPNGTRDNLTDADKAVDGDANTGWQTNWYKSPAFGNLKPGMGVLIDLGKPVDVANVKVDFDSPGATVSARVGDTDPGSSTSGDDQINKTYKTVTGPIKAGPSQVLPLGVRTRYVLIWITKLPSVGDGKYQVAVDEITVNGS